jgi:hypothetical protein
MDQRKQNIARLSNKAPIIKKQNIALYYKMEVVPFIFIVF